MRVLVVDDEPVARRRLVRMLGRIAGAEVVGEAGDGREALEKIRALAPDLVLLDIRMPGMSGLELAASSEPLPEIVFTTAHDEHAVAAFEVAAVDYLLKPIEQERLARALARARERHMGRDPAALRQALARLFAETDAAPRRLHARRGRTVHVLDPRDVPRIRAAAKYALCEHEGREFVLDESLLELEARLAPLGFLRVHRGELVNLNRVRALHENEGALEVELADGQRASVSRRFASVLRRRLGLD